MRRLILLSLLALLHTACVNVEYSFHPPDPTVKAEKEKELCAASFLIFGPGGTITVSQAMKEGGITRVHSVEHGDYYFLVGGARCTTVRGE